MESIKPQKSLVEQVHEAILDDICDGSLAAGTALRQDELAARLQVSRQPVMTALGLLRNQGFLVERGRRGLQVAPADRARFEAIYEFRSAIEPLAAALAARRRSAEWIGRARAVVAEGRRVAAAADARATLQADIDLHMLIYEAGGNPLILEAMQTHWLHLRRSMGEVLQRPRFTQKVWKEHAAIVEAIAAGDADRAAQLIGAHVREAQLRVGTELAATERAAA